MRDESKERSELLSAIQDLGYESLRFSIFNEHRPLEWETRIEFNPDSEEYEVYSTMDRASKGGIFQFKRFEEAEEKFLKNLELTVFIKLRWRMVRLQSILHRYGISQMRY